MLHSPVRQTLFGLLCGVSLVVGSACKPSVSPDKAGKKRSSETASSGITEAEITPPPSPTPVPTPRPIYIPRKQVEIAKLYNGARIKSTIETEPGGTSTKERNTDESYEVDIRVRLKIPRAHQSLEDLSLLNPVLSELLPGLPLLLDTGKVAPSYEVLYDLKMRRMERNLPRLDRLLSRHDFFDCETILHLQDPNTQRKVLLLQGDMDVDTDGSDGDRLPNPDGKDTYYQPMTSYKWPKRTDNPNPFLPASEAKLAKARQELADAQKDKNIGPERLQAFRDRVGAARYEVNQLKANSFLISATDPYIVLPGFMLREEHGGYTPKLGDYCAVIYNDVIYPAILGDAGPSHKVGEASLRLTKQLNARSTAYSRPVSSLKVTYLVFPGTAEENPEFPDLEKWHTKVSGFLGEIGGAREGALYAWETTWEPLPTPTPTPTPTPEPTPEASPESTPGATETPTGLPPEPTPAPSASPAAPDLSPAPSPLPSPLPSASPLG